jgi:CheY-like chemotaxis protein
MNKVLLVNDSKLENRIMKDMLSSIDYNVSITDEYNAIAAVKDFCPDYVITNYIMKEINGDQLAGLIKLLYPNIKFILSSSNSIDINKFDRRKINAVIKTPIEKNELKRVLESISSEDTKNDDVFVSIDLNKFCKSCGKSIELENYAFCPFCGSKTKSL